MTCIDRVRNEKVKRRAGVSENMNDGVDWRRFWRASDILSVWGESCRLKSCTRLMWSVERVEAGLVRGSFLVWMTCHCSQCLTLCRGTVLGWVQYMVGWFKLRCHDCEVIVAKLPFDPNGINTEFQGVFVCVVMRVCVLCDSCQTTSSTWVDCVLQTMGAL